MFCDHPSTRIWFYTVYLWCICGIVQTLDEKISNAAQRRFNSLQIRIFFFLQTAATHTLRSGNTHSLSLILDSLTPANTYHVNESKLLVLFLFFFFFLSFFFEVPFEVCHG